ncbi:Rad17p PWA37_002329 [Arxiozyma heterogenica]|uniref:Uncharacterized protein n=1 Tax=Arxiozyma heterogenica TaxID=278026 RepID=A0AAN7WP72_9SACH|nr:hypothetical protein RI543_000476 [Kazachstania heterogenica]
MDFPRFSASTVHLDHITTALNCLTPFGGNYDDSSNSGYSNTSTNISHNLNKVGYSIGGGGSSSINNDDVMIYIDRDGLSFIRDYHGSIRIQLLLSRELFLSYTFNDDQTISTTVDASDSHHNNNNILDESDCMKLCIKLSHLLDTINVVNKNQDDIIECTMNYDGYGSVFSLILQDSLVEEKVSYSTYLFNEALKDKEAELLQLQRDLVQFECIIKGDILYNALRDLKEYNAKECYLYAKVSSREDYNENVFALIAKSDIGYSKIILPNNRNIIEKLEIFDLLNGHSNNNKLLYDVPIIAYFDFNRFDKIRLSCRIASKVLIRLDTNGVLGVNILSQTSNIIISNKRQNNNNNNILNQQNSNNINNNRKPQLPIDYPGVVIEITMLTKDSLDIIAKQDIEMLIDITLKNMKKLRSLTNVKRPHPATIEPWNQTNNLLGLSNTASDNFNNDNNPNSMEDSKSEAETTTEGFTSSVQFDNMAFPFF